MDPVEAFRGEVEDNISRISADTDLQALSRVWIREISPYKWAYNFSWLGRPAIQFPTDAWALQELVFKVRPDLIIETGIAHGGSLMVSASLLAMLELCDAAESGTVVDPRNPSRTVLGIDIDIRAHNRAAIEAHPMAHRIAMIEGSSIDPAVVAQVRKAAEGKTVLVCLDSNHTHAHVLAELEAYAPLVSEGSYVIVYDTLVEDMPASLSEGRPWGPGNSPKSAVHAFLKTHGDAFEIDRRIDRKLLITVAPDGFLRRKSGSG